MAFKFSPRPKQAWSDAMDSLVEETHRDRQESRRIGINTSPLRPGAPLDEIEYPYITEPDSESIVSELTRAEVELMHAIARHRKAWARARALKTQLENTGIYVDSDLTYAKAIGDVRWWREEMAAQAAVVTALQTMNQDSHYRPA